MTEDTEAKLIDMNQRLIGLVNSMRNELRDLTGEVRVNQRTTDAQLQMIRQQMSAFTGFQRVQDESIQTLRERIERLERRVDLVGEDDAS